MLKNDNKCKQFYQTDIIINLMLTISTKYTSILIKTIDSHSLAAVSTNQRGKYMIKMEITYVGIKNAFCLKGLYLSLNKQNLRSVTFNPFQGHQHAVVPHTSQ